MRATVAARRIDEAIVVEAQAVHFAAVRRGRPTVAAVTDNVQAVIAVVAIPRSRIPDSGSTAELAGKVHTFIGTVVGASEF